MTLNKFVINNVKDRKVVVVMEVTVMEQGELSQDTLGHTNKKV